MMDAYKGGMYIENRVMIEQGLCFVMDQSMLAHTYNNIEKQLNF